MGKITKKVLNVGKFKRNALVVGSGFGYLGFLSDNLKTVFVIDNPSRELRKRNIIYKEDFTGISTLSEIDFVFIDHDQYGNLEKLHTLLTNNRTVIFVQGETNWPIAEYKYLRSLGYSHIDTYKGMQEWRPQ
jgi:hypothetical protein